jgi:hypothetical protein
MRSSPGRAPEPGPTDDDRNGSNGSVERVRGLPTRSGDILDRSDRPEHGTAHPPRRPAAGGLRGTSGADRPGHPVCRRRDLRGPPAGGPSDRDRRRRPAAGPAHRQGDAAALPDRAIAPESVVGIVQAIRRSADGRVLSYGLDDTRSAVVAVVSWWGGRAARRSRHIASHAPAGLSPAVLVALVTLSRVPTRVITALMPWLVQETRAEGR